MTSDEGISNMTSTRESVLAGDLEELIRLAEILNLNIRTFANDPRLEPFLTRLPHELAVLLIQICTQRDEVASYIRLIQSSMP